MSKSNITERHPYMAMLKSWRTPIFNFSLLLSIGLVTYAFNWTSYNPVGEVEDLIEIPLEPEVKIVRTKHEVKRTPPPPVIKPSTEVIMEDLDYEPEPEVIDPEVTVDDVEPIEPIIQPVTKAIPKAEPLPEVEAPPIERVFVVVEEMPRFKGCEDITDNKKERSSCATNKLLQYIYSQIKYPPIARGSGIEGTVVIQFTIEKDGSITDINIVKDVGGGCSAEAARVVRGMPDWIPGKQRNEKVRVRYNLPIKYKLQ
jgi:protein TonB